MTIGRLARQAGLARGTLLHYEALGLLQPQARSESGYRLYGKDAIERLGRIRHHREAGLSLADIGALLSAHIDTDAAGLLRQRLLALNAEIEQLRQQQTRLARLLALAGHRAQPPGKAAWTTLLRRAGFTDDQMWDWHAAFEADDAAGHARFLRALGLDAAERAAIRRLSRSPARP